jgi:hypothetical protein
MEFLGGKLRIQTFVPLPIGHIRGETNQPTKQVISQHSHNDNLITFSVIKIYSLEHKVKFINLWGPAYEI